MESDADDIASIVSDTVALIFTVDSVGVVDCISTLLLDSLFGCDTSVS